MTNDYMDIREEMWGHGASKVPADKRKRGDIIGKQLIQVSSHPQTFVVVKEATPKVIEQVKQKYSYLNGIWNEKDKENIRGKALPEADRIPDAGDQAGGKRKNVLSGPRKDQKTKKR